MEPLKPRDKVTQHMTRDGLTLDNQTTGESINVSSREAEQEYTAQPEGAAELLPALDQWELDGQGRSFCAVSAQTLEALCGALEAADIPFQRPEQPWSETCRVILAE